MERSQLNKSSCTEILTDAAGRAAVARKTLALLGRLANAVDAVVGADRDALLRRRRVAVAAHLDRPSLLHGLIETAKIGRRKKGRNEHKRSSICL
jgi:hypothetical protein